VYVCVGSELATTQWNEMLLTRPPTGMVAKYWYGVKRQTRTFSFNSSTSGSVVGLGAEVNVGFGVGVATGAATTPAHAAQRTSTAITNSNFAFISPLLF